MMDFPKTIPIPDIAMRLKEFQLLGYSVTETKPDRYIVYLVEDKQGLQCPKVYAAYRRKRNKKYYLDKRLAASAEWELLCEYRQKKKNLGLWSYFL